MEAIFLYTACFLLGLTGAALATGGLLWRFGQRCTKLEWALGDVEQRLSTFKGRDMAAKRWDKRDQLEMEMEAALKGSAPTRKRYDNDPLGE